VRLRSGRRDWHRAPPRPTRHGDLLRVSTLRMA
jgi:hypothetical protein